MFPTLDGWLRREENCGTSTVASFIPAIWGKPVLFLPADAQFMYVAALLNSKQVDSLYNYQGHQVLESRENGFQTPNPKWLCLFFRLNFVTLTQMQLSAESHWDTTRGSRELVLQWAQPSKPRVPSPSLRASWSGQICTQGLVTQLVWVQLLFFRSVLSSFV